MPKSRSVLRIGRNELPLSGAMRRALLVVVILLGLSVGCAEVEETESPEAPAAEEADDSGGSGTETEKKRKKKQGDSSGSGSDCASGYKPCLPVTGDLDCADVVAMGKAPVRVRGSDPYGLDGDNDGFGCE
jgi:hypothetical protein